MKKLIYPLMLGLLIPMAEGAKTTAKPAGTKNAPATQKPAKQDKQTKADDKNKTLDADPAQDALDVAKQLYFQASGMDAVGRVRLLGRAAELFSDIEKKHPGTPQSVEAKYMRAACLLDLGKESEAEVPLSELSGGGGGEFAAAAAYRLGGMRAKRGDWKGAKDAYENASKKTQRSELKHDATYRMAQALVKMGRKDEAEAVFRQLEVAEGVSDAISKASVLAVANICTEKGNDSEAYSLFLRLLNYKDLSDEQRGLATLQAARLAARLGKPEESGKHYAALASIPGMARYAGEAQMERILSLYKQKRYEDVIKAVAGKLAELPDGEQVARRALIVGQSHMALGQYNEADEWFEAAEAARPDTPTAVDASYRRLVCAHNSRSAHFSKMLTEHMSKYCNSPKNELSSQPCNDLVRVMYADRLISEASRKLKANDPKGNLDTLKDAMEVYATIKYANLPESVRSEAEYKRIWCAERTCEDGDSARCDEIIVMLDKFINAYKDSGKRAARVPDAYALRGSIYCKKGQYAEAIKSFQVVIDKYGDSSAAPYCMQRAAQAASKDESRKADMVRFYRSLVQRKDVKSPALAEAHYNIARSVYADDPSSAIDHFRKAKELDAALYGDHADVGIVQCYFKKKDSENLLRALADMEARNKDLYAKVNPAVLRWCGWTCFQGRNYVQAEKYLADSLKFEKQKENYVDAEGKTQQRPLAEPLVWKSLARTRLEIGMYAEGLEAAEVYLGKENQPYRQAEGMRDKALLLVGLGRTEDAKLLCEDAIKLGIDGPIKSSLFMALGDAWFAEGKYAESAKYYGRTANFSNDNESRPAALYKIAVALRKIGRVSEAAQYEGILKNEFPNWQPSDNIKRLIESDRNKKDKPSS